MVNPVFPTDFIVSSTLRSGLPNQVIMDNLKSFRRANDFGLCAQVAGMEGQYRHKVMSATVVANQVR